MLEDAKRYIENNINLIDNNMWYEFFKRTHPSFNMEIIEVLENANIEIDPNQECWYFIVNPYGEQILIASAINPATEPIKSIIPMYASSTLGVTLKQMLLFSTVNEAKEFLDSWQHIGSISVIDRESVNSWAWIQIDTDIDVPAYINKSQLKELERKIKYD